jgi:hypothetical protein
MAQRLRDLILLALSAAGITVSVVLGALMWASPLTIALLGGGLRAWSLLAAALMLAIVAGAGYVVVGTSPRD